MHSIVLVLSAALPAAVVAAPAAITTPPAAISIENEASDEQATKIYQVSGTLYGAPTLRGYNPSETFPPAVEINPQYAEGQEDDLPPGIFLDFSNIDEPQPRRGTRGATAAFERNQQLEKLNPDSLAPPTTDHGAVDQMVWPMAMSHTKLGRNNAGWSRQQNIDVMPVASKFAGVNMRLEAGAYRELHWHKASEWALMLSGSARIQAIDTDGRSFVDDVSAGDVWFFPPGVPHSIQGLANGTEFLLVFDDGEFSEDNTFLITETFANNPKEVLAKNFQLPITKFENIPKGELFIFNGTLAPENIEEQNITGLAGVITNELSYSYHWSLQEPLSAPGGTVKFLDSMTFPISTNVAAALVTIKPGAMREIHWHPTSDEWSFFLSGSARITVYAAEGNARTFDYEVGSVGYIPHAMGHYIENTGMTDVVVLEIILADRFTDFSVGQWLALTPKQIVMDTLNLDEETVDSFSKIKPFVVDGPVPPNTVLEETKNKN